MKQRLCKCGCGQPVRKGKRFLSGHNSRVAHPMQGRKHTKESQRKMSKVKRSRVTQNQQSHPDGPLCACGCGGRAKPGNRYIYTHNRKGTPLSEAHKQAIGKGSKAAWQDPDTRLGSQEHREKLRQALLGREVTWKDNIYTKRSRPGWKRLRREIRKRDDYTCQECGKRQASGKRAYHVHHINYDLNDLRPENLITLCRPCHGKTGATSVREFYQQRYTELLKTRGIC
jgi:5-methylcytosine-specific restriction endonuclease McrA